MSRFCAQPDCSGSLAVFDEDCPTCGSKGVEILAPDVLTPEGSPERPASADRALRRLG